MVKMAYIISNVLPITKTRHHILILCQKRSLKLYLVQFAQKARLWPIFGLNNPSEGQKMFKIIAQIIPNYEISHSFLFFAKQFCPNQIWFTFGQSKRFGHNLASDSLAGGPKIAEIIHNPEKSHQIYKKISRDNKSIQNMQDNFAKSLKSDQYPKCPDFHRNCG